MTALCNWQISGFHCCLLATSIPPFPLYLKIVSTGFIYLGSHWEVLSSILSVPFSLSDVGEVIPGLRVWSCLDDQRWQKGFSQAQVWCVISEASWKNFLIYAPNSDQEECSLVILVRCFFSTPCDRDSLCSTGCPGTQSVDPNGLKLINLPASASQVLGLKECATMTGNSSGFYSYK